MALKQEIKEFEGKKFRINEMRPMDARKVMLRWGASLEKDDDGKENQGLFYLLMKYVEVEIASDKWIRLDTEELVNQHTRGTFINKIGDEVISLSLGFYEDGKNINS